MWTLWARIWAANQAWNLMHKPRLRGPHPHDKIPRTGFCVGSCSSTLVVDLFFRASPFGWAWTPSREFLDDAWLPIITPLCLFTASVFLCLLCQNPAQTWSEWQLNLPYRLLAKPCPLAQPTLSATPARQNLYCARRGGGPWHEICGWASIQVQGLSPLPLLSLNSCRLLHPHALKYVMHELQFFA